MREIGVRPRRCEYRSQRCVAAVERDACAFEHLALEVRVHEYERQIERRQQEIVVVEQRAHAARQPRDKVRRTAGAAKAVAEENRRSQRDRTRTVDRVRDRVRRFRPAPIERRHELRRVRARRESLQQRLERQRDARADGGVGDQVVVLEHDDKRVALIVGVDDLSTTCKCLFQGRYTTLQTFGVAMYASCDVGEKSIGEQ